MLIEHINSILCVLSVDGLIVTYADDTCLLFFSNIWETAVHAKVKIGVNKVGKTFRNQKLSLNLSKIGFIAFSIKN